MPLDTRRWLRFTDEQWEELRQQAERLGTDRTGYIKTIIKIDAATEILKKLREH